ncbi:RNA-directed DNA polymerase (reverse transcriptase)-related family protein [Thalictrum thalictroides]|uniref:RNA-directed DNA polymerase (Reverse transcriptase)-related family protein n=1 Tax=Thalictrum thalictroides TaxID=46969 RepID=A0A7J6X5I9_THATH|nr:RNA-directed DNA polymerase (reverse transcriptase)-related family protein [Thalictrum thalictroides]
MDGWRNKLLSQGGKLILLNHVLQSILIYQLSAFSIPSSVIKTLKIMFSNFLWGSAQGKLKKQWISWDRIAKPKEEGGLGVRPLKTIFKAFRMKATWNLLNSDNLWAIFMRAKYIQNRSIRGIRLVLQHQRLGRTFGIVEKRLLKNPHGSLDLAILVLLMRIGQVLEVLHTYSLRFVLNIL